MEKIAILTGGDSAEHNISLLSANNVIKHLNKTKYHGTIVYLKNNNYTIKNQQLNISDFSYIYENKKIKFDKVFIALHGPPAENGLIQNYFDSIKLPYTSCNAKISALTFNKFKCNKKLEELGFTWAKSILINSEINFSENNLIKNIGLPLFVKPNGAGSSHGISKVYKKSDLKEAIKTAFTHDKNVIIESYINGIEVSCGVYSHENEVKALPITEIVTENEFFDYAAKYEGKAKEITPARISNQLTSDIKQITKKIYNKMSLSGFCRVDFIIKNNCAYVIEINTIPGLSEESIIPQQLKADNISLSDFFDICLSNVD